MDKTSIIDEIRRTAGAEGGKPPGSKRFCDETGIKAWEWQKHWARWGDALREAGHVPNEFQGSYDKKFLLTKYAELARELGALPANSEMTLKSRNDPTFPSRKAFRRLGSKAELVRTLSEFCQSNGAFQAVLRMCESYSPAKRSAAEERATRDDVEFGSVYLLRSGRFYKIGKTNAAGRRERELAIQLPEKATTVHVITTDDPGGIEGYWHKRFAAKRANGEWFALDAADVAAFKRRRKFM